jgi:hypothetical protein
MLRSRIAEWSYRLGSVSAAVAIIYRAMWFGGIGARLFGVAPRIVPHNFVDLSILLLVISIAVNTNTWAQGGDGRPAGTGKAA